MIPKGDKIFTSALQQNCVYSQISILLLKFFLQFFAILLKATVIHPRGVNGDGQCWEVHKTQRGGVLSKVTSQMCPPIVPKFGAGLDIWRVTGV